MSYWSISVPIECFIPNDFPSVNISDVVFHIFQDRYLDKPYLFGTVVVEGNDLNAEHEGSKLINIALSKLQLIHGYPLLMIKDDVRRIKVEKREINIDNPNVGPRRVTSSLSFWYRVGNKGPDETIQRIGNILPEKESTLNKSLSYFRVAICALNPFQAIESYFSCISSIVMEDVGHQPSKSELRNLLEPIVGHEVQDFDATFENYYGKYRSASTHGDKNILDEAEVNSAIRVSEDLKSWARRIIHSFINKYQKQNG